MGMFYAQNELVAELRIIDSRGTVYFDMENESVVPIVTRASEVWHNGEHIGYIEISLTSAYYQEINQQLLWASIFTIGINLLSLIIMTGFLLRRFLRKPLKDLGEIVNSYASGKYDSSGHRMSFIEFQPFVAVLGEMGDRIKSQMTELRKHQEHLEELVQKRTAELTKANQHLRQQIEERERAEEALRESEKSLAEAQRVARMGNWNLDLVKNELRWSDEIYRIFGLKPQEFDATYEAFLNAVHPDDREFVDTSYTKSVKSNTPYDIVHRIVRSDGEVRWVHEKAEDIKDETEKTIRSIGTVQDITERKRAEDDLQNRLDELTETRQLMLSMMEDLEEANKEAEMRTLDLQKEVSTRKKTEEELQNNIQTLERFRKMAVGREKQMIKLKEEINELLINQGREKKYKIVG